MSREPGFSDLSEGQLPIKAAVLSPKLATSRRQASTITNVEAGLDMTERDASPRRRHILASINREPPEGLPDGKESASLPAAAPGEPEPMAAQAAEADSRDGSTRPHRHRRRLRLKDPKRHRSRQHRGEEDDRRHRRRRKRSRSPTPPNPHELPPLDPETAFRESLFDAMADDEGAAYWEAVYGQPVHVYSNERLGPGGELERMTDEEYAAYVRQKMWEKTHEGLLEERRKRQEAREEEARRERERKRLEKEVRRSLRYGEERRREKGRRDRWAQYLRAWAEWDGSTERIPWPVESGARGDVSEDTVKTFFFDGLKSTREGELAKGLRDERVRWHPDKMQQRLGGEVNAELMKDVTAIFQTVDKLWTDTQHKGD